MSPVLTLSLIHIFHRQVVVAGGDDQVDPGDETVLVDAVVVHQRAARRLGDADAVVAVGARVGPHPRRQQLGILQQTLHHFQRVDDLDQPRVVVVEAAGHRPLFLQHAELGQCHVGVGRAAGVGVVQPGQRADAVDAAWVAHGLVVRELHVAPVLGRFAHQAGVVARCHLVFHDAALGVLDAQHAVVVFQVAVRGDQAQEQRGLVAEVARFFGEARHHGLVEGVGALGDLQALGHQGQHGVALGPVQRLGHAAGHDPGRVDLLAAQGFDDGLPDLAQPDAVPGQGRVLPHHAEDVAIGHVGVPAEQQVGRGPVSYTHLPPPRWRRRPGCRWRRSARTGSRG